MCKAIEELKRDSRIEGAEEVTINYIKNLMSNKKETFEEICIAMGINKKDMARYKKMI